jgi:hypothetical protein
MMRFSHTTKIRNNRKRIVVMWNVFTVFTFFTVFTKCIYSIYCLYSGHFLREFFVDKLDFVQKPVNNL